MMERWNQRSWRNYCVLQALVLGGIAVGIHKVTPEMVRFAVDQPTWLGIDVNSPGLALMLAAVYCLSAAKHLAYLVLYAVAAS